MAHNEKVAKFYIYTLEAIPSEVQDYLSADRATDQDRANFVIQEFLNTLEISGWPSHKLRLKINAPIILLQNLDPSNRLYSGTRLIVRRFLARVIEAEILTRKHAGKPLP